ncbi:hypothetical protein ACWKWU_03210 [Chitinophaga lutea]
MVNHTNSSNSEGISDFLEAYPTPKDVYSQTWELILAAMGSDHADTWSKEERAAKLHYLELMDNFVTEVYALLQDSSRPKRE